MIVPPMVRAKEGEGRDEMITRLQKDWPELNSSVLAAEYEEIEAGRAWKRRDKRPAVLDSSFRRR